MQDLTDLERAKTELACDEHIKCVLQKGTVQYRSEKRGVAPMLDFLEQGLDLHGFCAADRVVGKATAFLFVLAGVSSVYGEVMSEGARAVLLQYGVVCQCKQTVPYIINRRGDGACPMETAVREINDPNEAYLAVKKTQKMLSEM
ncbi:MAG: DUF1893 domain-containing protein [Clostridia bacterium]|nr:DUF1893 domain-containing protein [Clostridia bacterium]